ncbi:Hypothetical_protein [Hexamita inflata]|uniref:Hypothetical_protein n=1 Tax=Hexamita inflata TaxID=28002 RepID=A0AA86U8C5_9EUKA|nr:Hypothetical protein HINF_LOCUS21003 [Hexamita inflata]
MICQLLIDQIKFHPPQLADFLTIYLKSHISYKSIQKTASNATKPSAVFKSPDRNQSNKIVTNSEKDKLNQIYIYFTFNDFFSKFHFFKWNEGHYTTIYMLMI